MLSKCQEASPVPGLQIPQCSMLLLEPWSATKTPANLIRDVDLDSQFLRPGPNEPRILQEHASCDGHIEPFP